MINSIIKELIKQSLNALLIEAEEINLEHPTDFSHGDYSTNIALVLGKKNKKNPVALAVLIVEKINLLKDENIEKVVVAGAGFINFYLSKAFFQNSLREILNNKDFGKNNTLEGKKVVIEYTDPNPFKQFHIGHLMANTIGQSLSNLIEWNGAEVKRVCYQGDEGRHVALCIWGFQFVPRAFPSDEDSLEEKVRFLGEAYALGSKNIAEDPTAEIEVKEINRKIFERSDEELNDIYDKGREWSLLKFEEIYKKLGTTFDRYFFESVTSKIGKEIVEKNIGSIFEKSEGAVIFPGEKYDLHTRVFINSEGLPTYEAKDIGLAEIKYEAFPFDRSIIVSGNEQNEYFKVMQKALSLIYPNIALITEHISHGMLRLLSGKMGSRMGNVITGESLISDTEKLVEEKIKDREFDEVIKRDVAEKVAIAAIKYSILKQTPGKDIIYDVEKSLSFEGDSGPYLQYSYIRAKSVMEKAGSNEGFKMGEEKNILDIERLLYRFPQVLERAYLEMAPQHVATYLIHLSASFNNFYAHHKILEAGTETSYRLAVTSSFMTVMKNGLCVMGISLPERM